MSQEKDKEKERQRILAVPGTGEIGIWFNENDFHVNLDTMSDIALSTVLNGETTGFDLTRVEYGTIKCFYNPTRMDLSQAQKGSKRMVDYIASCSTKADSSDR